VLEPAGAGDTDHARPDAVPGPRLRLANAGQVPPLHCRGGRAAELRPPGEAMPLGVLPHPRYQEVVLDLEARDVVVFASDGLVEAPAHAQGAGARRQGAEVEGGAGPDDTIPPASAPREMFGFDRLAASAEFWAANAESAEAVLNGIWADVGAWCGPESHHDDMTLLVLRVPARRPQAAP
jgi:serine phosphatase RsbU (regulator of sigma subunit)